MIKYVQKVTNGTQIEFIRTPEMLALSSSDPVLVTVDEDLRKEWMGEDGVSTIDLVDHPTEQGTRHGRAMFRRPGAQS